MDFLESEWLHLERGIQLFRRKDFFGCHEEWEEVWRRCVTPYRLFLQAMILLAAALHHLQRRNLHGFVSSLSKAQTKCMFYKSQLSSAAPPSLVRLEEILKRLEANKNSPADVFRIVDQFGRELDRNWFAF